MYESHYSKYGLHKHIEILPGWDWLRKHEHDLDNWTPAISMSLNGVKYSIKNANHKTINQVIKANR